MPDSQAMDQAYMLLLILRLNVYFEVYVKQPYTQIVHPDRATTHSRINIAEYGENSRLTSAYPRMRGMRRLKLPSDAASGSTSVRADTSGSRVTASSQEK